MSTWLVEQNYAVPYDGGTKAIDVSTLRTTPEPRAGTRPPSWSQTPPARPTLTTPSKTPTMKTPPTKTPPAKTPPAKTPPAAQPLPGLIEILRSDGPRKAIGH